MKAIIKIYINNRLVKIVEPKWDKRYEVLSQINKNILKEVNDKS
jgi:hypothetical protein